MDDYIKRSDAIEESRKPWITRAELRRRICNITPADVRPVVRGEWIETGYFDQDYQPIYECSHCHREVADNFMAKHLFCLHCGADMRTIGQQLRDISAEEDLFPDLTAEENAENKAEAKRMIGGANG